MENADVAIVGAGPAGLACAASIRALGLRVTVLEKSDAVGAVWRRHYDRLHLHTDKGNSGLPGLPMPHSYPRYPSRAQVVQYLESYAKQFNLEPVFGANVRSVRREGSNWQIEAGEHSLVAPAVVVATGWADFPYEPTWPGQDSYQGSIIHSSAYRNPAPYAGKRVLVVGFGNSGGEIALDLAEKGIDVSLSVRGPVQILPRELLGLPILSWAIAQRHLPARLSDFINAPAIRLAVGSLRKLGLQRASIGPRRMVEQTGRVPLLDVGTLAKIRDGSIKVNAGIERFEPGGVHFSDGKQGNFDAVILATGFRPDARKLLPESTGVYDDTGKPFVTGGPTSEPGLFFCGFITSPNGQFREIGIEAKRIAAHALRHVRG